MFQYKCIRNQIWPCLKKVKVNPDSSFMQTLEGPSNPNVTNQVPRLSAFCFWRRRFLKRFSNIWAWRPSWSGDQTILYFYFGYIIIRGFHMKFEFNCANGFWENYVLIYWLVNLGSSFEHTW